MGDMAILYGQAKKLALIIQDGLGKLEETEAGGRHGDPAALARDLRAKLSDLQRLTQDLEGAWRIHGIREAHANRTKWKGKVEQMIDEVQFIRRALDKYGTREQKRQAERSEREELFSRAQAGRQALSDVDAENQMIMSVGRSKHVIDEIYESGQNILNSMSSNRERLKAAQSKMLDVLNSVNLGSTLLRVIRRRHRMDMWMTYGGMVLMLLFVLWLMWFMWG